MIKILLVEDDLGLSNSVFDFLDDFADVMQVFDGEEGLYEAESGVYDLILLDLMLPEKDGFQVLKDLRAKGVTTPVLIMTAKESLDDKGHGFELGADDYLTKPFYLEELKMRIQALLKRAGKFNENTLSYGDVTVNLSTNSTTKAGKDVELLGKEFDLLVYFLQNQNVILPKTQRVPCSTHNPWPVHLHPRAVSAEHRSPTLLKARSNGNEERTGVPPVHHRWDPRQHPS